MKKYEYTVFNPTMKRGLTSKKISPDQLADDLTELYGKYGWELVATVPVTGNAGIASWGAATVNVIFVFKREIQ